jgi:hypothetical protein
MKGGGKLFCEIEKKDPHITATCSGIGEGGITEIDFRHIKKRTFAPGILGDQ